MLLCFLAANDSANDIYVVILIVFSSVDISIFSLKNELCLLTQQQKLQSSRLGIEGNVLFRMMPFVISLWRCFIGMPFLIISI